MMGIAEWPAIFLGLHRIMTVNSSCLDAHRNHRRAEVRARIWQLSWFTRPRLSPTLLGSTGMLTDLNQHSTASKID